MKYCNACGAEAQNTMVMCAQCGNREFADMPVTSPSSTDTSQQKSNKASINNAHSPSSTTQNIGPSSGSDVPAGWLATPITPWRRFGARLLDLSFFGALGFFIIGFVYYAIAPYSADKFFSFLEQPGAPIIDAIMTAFVGSIITGAVIGLSGSSLGKAIFGIVVVNKHGNKIGLADGIKRDLAVYLRGLGLGIPIVSLVTIYTAFRTLKDTGETSWDAENEYQVWHRPSGQAQYVLNVIGIVLYFVILVGVSVFGAL